VTRNAALQRTYHGNEPALEAARRAERAHARVCRKGPEVARALKGERAVPLVTDLAARSTGKQIEKSRRRPTPFAEAHRKASARVLPQACNEEMSSQAHKEGEP